MASFNKVILMGNLTRDPEMRVTPGGLSICRFSLAVNRAWKDKDGQEKEEVSYIDVDSFGKQAEVIAKYLTKGRPVLIEGRLKQDRWEDKNTKEKRTKILVVLESFTFVGSRGETGGDAGDGAPSGANYDDSAPPARPASRAAGSPPAASRPPPPGDQIDEDVPF
jgi:single-strand DNA-binding protein